MPGLTGLISSTNRIPSEGLSHALDSLRYGCAVVTESYSELNFCMGCIHLGTGGQKSLFQSSEAVVLFYGYLTSPPIPPGAVTSSPHAAAQHIHDLYLAQGEAYMINQIAGAFAFALWDKKNKTLLLVSDHLGLRSIYYAEHNGIFRFASEVKGILVDSTFPHRADHLAIAEFFHFSYIIGEKTFFQDIKLLPPASVLRYHEGDWKISSYWDISYPESYPHRPDRWYDDLIHDTLQGAVGRMADANICYGLSLSGGMDSRWIAALLSIVRPESKSFTVGIPGSDDTHPAHEVAIRTNLTNIYWDISPSFVAELGEIYTYIVDGMYDLFSIEEFPLTVQVGNHADVSVGGFLGDCLFGHEINPVSAILRKNDIKQYWLNRQRGSWLQSSIATQVFGKNLATELTMMAMTSLETSITASPSERGFQVLQYINIRNRQIRFINIAQQAKLSYVDIYTPLADLEVIKAALQLPPDQLILERAYRRSLTTYFPNLAAIPWTFTLTPPTISVSGIILKKVAQLTLGRWLKNTPLGASPLIRPRRYYSNFSSWSRNALRPFIEETLFSRETNAVGLFEPNGLRAVIRDHMENKRDATTFIGRALAIALWTRLFYIPSIPKRPLPLFTSGHGE